MARRTAQKTTKPLPLEGCSIATSGKIPGTTQAALATRIASLGATVVSKVTADTTFLLATEKEYESNSTKVKSAASHNVPVVKVEWLDECESADKKADEAQFLLSSSPNSTSASLQTVNGSKKRLASASSPSLVAQDASQPKKPKIDQDAKVGDGQNSKSKKLVISVDEYCPGSYEVYIDDDGTIMDASLNQTNASANNNKFYKVQLVCNGARSDFKTYARWGRVGERGQSSLLGDGSLIDAVKNFEKKFREKSGLKWSDRGQEPKTGKYAYIERSYDPDSDEEEDTSSNVDANVEEPRKKSTESVLEPAVQNLMKLIFNQSYFDATMTELNYDANKLPLGKLSKGTIARGFQALKDLAVHISGSGVQSGAEVERLSNLYYSVIPHAFGRNRPPIILDNDHLKKEIELLESLSDMKEAAAMLKSTLQDGDGIHRLDKQFQGLNMNEMSPIDHKSQEFMELEAYLNDSKGDTHYMTYKVEDIFRIERQGELDRFEKSKFSKISSQRRLLWHGSRVTNFAGILSQGLRIAPPEAPVSGYMFGKGIYLADMSSKSANYCCAYSSGRTALLLLCEAELGNPMHELTNASYNADEDARAKGMHSTWGKGMTGPSKWKDAKSVNRALSGCMMPDVSVTPGPTNVANAYLQYNEYIAYDVAQVRLRYLFRVRM